MPRRKNWKQNINRKKKMKVTSRLMQISLMVDDYIYRHKAISESGARALLGEVAGYSDACCGDARTLQVIEKLIRFLKTIIEEQQEFQTENATELTSDVAAITETKTSKSISVLNQELDVDNVLVSITKKIKLTNNGHRDAKRVNNVGIKLFSEEELDKQRVIENKDNTNIEKPISDIYDDDDPLLITNVDYEVYSQSILDNFEPIIEATEKTKNASFTHDVLQNQKANVLDNEMNNAHNKHILTNTDVTFTTNSKLNQGMKAKKQEKRISKKFKECCSHEQKANKKSRASNSKTDKVGKETKNNKSDQKFYTDHKSKPARSRKNKQKNNAITKMNPSKNQNKVTLRGYRHKSITIEDKKNCENNFNIDTESQFARKLQGNHKMPYIPMKKAGKKPIDIIYSKDTEIDLSWVENLRYVRVVTKEEHYPTLYDNDFWESCSLPKDCNDDDFLLPT